MMCGAGHAVRAEGLRGAARVAHIEKFIVRPGKSVHMDDYDPDDTLGLDRSFCDIEVEKTLKRLDELQYRLYAENKRALLIVLQAMDAGGKDSTIRHVMRGANPASCKVTSFKQPSQEELEHDFLWRVHRSAPGKGQLGIFNRSHYEDVLVVRVHELVPKEVWHRRYEEINAFERYLAQNELTVLKFYLNISKEEQKKRFEARIQDPTRHWKLSPADFAERKLWNDYMKAYEDALSRCSAEHAPWFVIPSNHKWFRNYAVSNIIVETLEKMDPKFPKPVMDVAKIQFE
jgi:PPK2 family polyphosphate:nucleotide phosphotransferase